MYVRTDMVRMKKYCSEYVHISISPCLAVVCPHFFQCKHLLVLSGVAHIYIRLCVYLCLGKLYDVSSSSVLLIFSGGSCSAVTPSSVTKSCPALRSHPFTM